MQLLWGWLNSGSGPTQSLQAFARMLELLLPVHQSLLMLLNHFGRRTIHKTLVSKFLFHLLDFLGDLFQFLFQASFLCLDINQPF